MARLRIGRRRRAESVTRLVACVSTATCYHHWLLVLWRCLLLVRRLSWGGSLFRFMVASGRLPIGSLCFGGSLVSLGAAGFDAASRYTWSLVFLRLYAISGCLRFGGRLLYLVVRARYSAHRNSSLTMRRPSAIFVVCVLAGARGKWLFILRSLLAITGCLRFSVCLRRYVTRARAVAERNWSLERWRKLVRVVCLCFRGR